MRRLPEVHPVGVVRVPIWEVHSVVLVVPLYISVGKLVRRLYTRV